MVESEARRWCGNRFGGEYDKYIEKLAQVRKMLYLCTMIPRGKCYRILVVAVMMVWLSSLQGVCAGTPMPWSEAREVVREAYRMHGEGKAYEDSVSLAQAYTELNKWKYLFPTDFVRACYYYGRWLRALKDLVPHRWLIVQQIKMLFVDRSSG